MVRSPSDGSSPAEVILVRCEGGADASSYHGGTKKVSNYVNTRKANPGPTVQGLKKIS